MKIETLTVPQGDLHRLLACGSGDAKDLYEALLAYPIGADTKAARKLWKFLLRDSEKYIAPTFMELEKYQDDGKNPNPIAKGMSWMKTNMKLSMEESDATVAELMTDGCNMGVKSLNRYLNQYKAADEVSKDMAKRLINLEEKLAVDIRGYL